MKRLALFAAILLTACDGTYATHSAPLEDPCLYRTYHDPMCDTGFSWSPGYYDQSHVYVAPRYIRRTVVVPHYVTPAPVIVNRPTCVAPRSVIVVPSPRPSYRTPLTTMTTVRQSSPSRPRPATTVTTTRRYR